VHGLLFLYGDTGSTSVSGIAKARSEAWLTLGLLAVLTGVAFKIAAFPFHMWVPDTYEAASTPFVAWLSVAPKAAAVSVTNARPVSSSLGTIMAWWMRPSTST